MRKGRIVHLCGFFIGIAAMAVFAVGTWPGHADAQNVPKLQELGKRVFFDNISVPKRMSCSTCHNPSAGWTLKNAGTNQHQVAVTGADPHTAGSLKPPSNAYASFIPPFQPCGAGLPGLCGGNFWNGRSEGNDPALFPDGATQHVGNEVFYVGGLFKSALANDYGQFQGPVADQALNPFPNKVEQNIEIKAVCEHVKASKYAPLFTIVWMEPIVCTDTPHNNRFKAYEVNFRRIALALSAWQASKEVNSFSSKRDKELAKDGTFPLAGFTAQENLGHDLFYNTRPIPFLPEGTPPFNVRPFPNLPVTNCSFCHRSGAPNGTTPDERYTDDAYHNIGTPANPEIPGYPVPNAGLAGHTDDPLHFGFHKTPTLRNVDKRPGKGFTKAYAHNGWFKSMESIVHFYNTADVNPIGTKLHSVARCEGDMTEKEALAQNCWPAPEVVGPGLAIGAIFGNLGLTPEQEAAIVSYLKTFTDTYTPKEPAPYK